MVAKLKFNLRQNYRDFLVLRFQETIIRNTGIMVENTGNIRLATIRLFRISSPKNYIS